MQGQVNYSVNHGGNFVIKSARCSFFRRLIAHKHQEPCQEQGPGKNSKTISVSATSV